MRLKNSKNNVIAKSGTLERMRNSLNNINAKSPKDENMERRIQMRESFFLLV